MTAVEPVMAETSAIQPAFPNRLSITVLPFQNMTAAMRIKSTFSPTGCQKNIIALIVNFRSFSSSRATPASPSKARILMSGMSARNWASAMSWRGSVRKSGNRVRITSQLIEATSGGHLWAERFDRDLTDIFAVQDDVTQQIVTALALALSEGDRQRLLTEHTDNLEAYDLFLRGRELWWRQTKEANVKARELLQRASKSDPSFAPAFAFLGAAHVVDYINGWSASPLRSLEDAREAARRTVVLDERYPTAHWALAGVNLWSRQHDEAIREAERAISLNPNYADGHNFLGLILHYSGRSEHSSMHFDRAMALNPYFPDVWLHFQAQAAYQLGRYEAAVAILKRRILRNPDTDASRVLLAASYGQIGLIDEARSVAGGAAGQPQLFPRAAPRGTALQESRRFRADRRGPAQGRAAGIVTSARRVARTDVSGWARRQKPRTNTCRPRIKPNHSAGSSARIRQDAPSVRRCVAVRSRSFRSTRLRTQTRCFAARSCRRTCVGVTLPPLRGRLPLPRMR